MVRYWYMVISKLNVANVLSQACAQAGYDPLSWQTLSLLELIAADESET